MTIFLNTFRNLLRWKFTLIFIIVMAILPTILSFVLRNEIYSNGMSFQSQLDFTIGIYCILVFMWIFGIPFLIITTAKGIGLIADEVSDGTLGLLVSTKISRLQIVFAKWLALFVVTIMLGILSLLLNLLILTKLSGMDSNISSNLLQTVPNLIYYLLFISFIFSNISILLSLIIKSKVFATVSITFFIVVVFLIIPLFKTFLISYYEDYNLFYIDLNYHFSLIYYYFFSKSNLELAPTMQMVVGTFVGVFNIKHITDVDLVTILKAPIFNKAPLYSYIDTTKLIIFWFSFGFISLLFSMIILTKSDIT